METGRLLARLAQLVDDADLDGPRVEARAGLERGQLARLLDRRRELRFRDLLAVLDVLSVTPDAFFASLYPPRAGAPARRGRRRARDRVAVSARADVASVFGFGVESLCRLRRRLERCELALLRLQRVVASSPDGP